jgi:diaminopimelate epimerase
VTRSLSVAKYQASGNDFLIIDAFDSPAPAMDVPALCDRWFGVGADGIIVVGRGSAAEFSFGLTNADGTPAEMSGNGMRCVGAWLRDTDRVSHGASFDVETPAGVKHVWLTLDGATVGMGQPNFTKAAIPMHGPAWENDAGNRAQHGQPASRALHRRGPRALPP